jgi:hypothetical protein
MLLRRINTIRSRVASRAALALVLASLIALPAGAGTAIALADGGDSSAVAVNTKDDSFVFRLTFAILQVTGAVVDNQNAAVAYSNCSLCQTVAISIQTLLVSGDATTFAPVNEAIALDQSCDQCDTLAIAYQFVVGIGSRLKFTAEGRQEIADIRHQLEMLRNSGLTGPQIDAAVRALMAQYGRILQTQLIPVNQPAGAGTTGTTGPATPPDTSPTSTAPGSAAPTDTTTAPTGTTPTTTTTTTPTDTTTTTPTSTTPTTTSTTPTDTTTTTTTPTSATP